MILMSTVLTPRVYQMASLSLSVALVLSWIGQGGSGLGTHVGIIIAAISFVILRRFPSSKRAATTALSLLLALSTIAIISETLTFGIRGRVLIATPDPSLPWMVQTILFDATTISAVAYGAAVDRGIGRALILGAGAVFLAAEFAAQSPGAEGTASAVASGVGFVSTLAIASILAVQGRLSRNLKAAI